MNATIRLPFPVSVNAIWRRGRNPKTKKPVVYLDKTYKAWKLEADAMLFQQKPLPRIVGNFQATITLDRRKRKADGDNLIKVCLDCLQRAEIIENDKLSDRTIVQWGDVDGCTVDIVQA